MLAPIRFLLKLGPLLFGICFLAPLIGQVMTAQDWAVPMGMTPLSFGLVVGALLGLIANIRGRWV